MRHSVSSITEDAADNDLHHQELLSQNTDQFTNDRTNNYNNDIKISSKLNSDSPSEKKNDNYKQQFNQSIQESFEALHINLPENWTKLKDREKMDLINKLIFDKFPNLPESLITVTAGMMVPGDCGRPSDEVPDWLDREKFARGQRFARENMFGIYFGELLSLYTLFSFHDGLKPMIMTGKSSVPYTAFKR